MIQLFSTQALELPSPTHKTVRHHCNRQVTTQNSPVQTRTQPLTDHCFDCLFVLLCLVLVLFIFYFLCLFFFFHNVLWKNDIYIYDDYMLCKVTLGVLKGASKLYVLLLGVKQLCCETTYCFCTNSYYWVPSNYVARQPIVFVRIPIIIIGCLAT